MQFADRQLTCMDCGQPFTFTAGEQEFFDRKGFKEEPKRCKICREARKTRRNNDFASEGNEAPAPASGGGGGGGGARSPEARPVRGPREVRVVNELRGRGPRELFDAVCADCGTSTKVPFRPVAGRPVFCRDCFAAKKGVGA